MHHLVEKVDVDEVMNYCCCIEAMLDLCFNLCICRCNYFHNCSWRLFACNHLARVGG